MSFFIWVIILLAIIDVILFIRKKEKREDIKRHGIVIIVVFILYLSIPSNFNSIIYNRKEKVEITSSDMQKLNINKDLENIKNEFKINDSLDVAYFDMDFSANGQVQRVSMMLIGKRYNSEVVYNVLYDKDITQGKYDVSSYKNTNNFQGKIECKYFFDKLNMIKDKRPPSSDYDEYRISLLGETSYRLRNNKAVYIDKDNKAREITKDDSEIKGIMIILEGTKRNGYDVNTASPAQTSIGRVDFIIDKIK